MNQPAATPATSPPKPSRTWRFGDFLLDEGERRLAASGRAVGLSPRAFDLLVLLVERHGRLVRREELVNLLWPDAFVEDGTLARHVSDLRKALGEAAGLVETVPKAGYRFAAEVQELAPSGLPVPEPQPVQGEEAVARRWVLGAGVGLALLLLAALGWRLAVRLRPAPALRPASVAVLPFTAIGADQDAEHLEIGIADVLILQLSQLPDLEVRPLGAVSRYAGTTFDPLAAGRTLRVDAVLEGTFRHREGRLRVSARLLSVADGRSLWAGSFDHPDRDLLAVEDAIAREAILALAPALQPATPGGAAVARAAIDPEAHDLYLRGRFFWAKRTSAANQRAVELFDAALARVPDYPEAEAGLAAAYALLAGLAQPPELYEQARRHAERALSLDPRSADAHAVLGLVAENYDGDWARAEGEYQRALALQPNHPTAHHWYGEMLALLGRFDEGLALLDRAARLDPLSLAIATDIAKAHYFARHWDEAVLYGEEVLAMDSQYAWAWAWVGAAEIERGNLERGLECLTHFDQLEASPFSAAIHIWALVAMGKTEEAEARHQELEAAATSGYVMPVSLAMARLALGDQEGALDALDKLVATRQNRIGVSTSPIFDPLRDQPRYQDLLRRAGLPPPRAAPP